VLLLPQLVASPVCCMPPLKHHSEAPQTPSRPLLQPQLLLEAYCSCCHMYCLYRLLLRSVDAVQQASTPQAHTGTKPTTSADSAAAPHLRQGLLHHLLLLLL
jgi:hypothetical protein